MKPLELTVYPRRRVTLEGFSGKPEHHFEYAVCGRLVDEQDIHPSIKRLTSAELAAEYWASHGDANALMTGNPKLLFSKRQTLRRFATLPHYDEPAA